MRAALEPDETADEAAITAAARHRARRRRVLVNLARALTLVVVVGGWQLFTDWKIVDPFFFGQPSAIWTQLVDWFEHGHRVRLDLDADLDDDQGGAARLRLRRRRRDRARVLLGQNRFLADVLGPYIKVMNAIPRIVLGSIFVVWLGLGTTSKVALAAVLVFFVVFFNAFQGVREVDRNLIANVRVLGASRLQVTRHVSCRRR